MKNHILNFVATLLLVSMVGCDNNGSSNSTNYVMVNSLADIKEPESDVMTLRSALAKVEDDQTILFDESLDGGTIALNIVGQEHSILKGEVMGMRDEPSGPVSYLVGYFERDYGKSALYTRKDIHIDASNLSQGITLSWDGGPGNPARVLAVYGDLILNNVSITNGASIAVALPTNDLEDQPWTLARGAGIAVWGTAQLLNCRIYDNSCEGDFDASRDRGAFGGGVYANILDIQDSIISGNTIMGAGAAGGGVYSVGGADVTDRISEISRSSITGNRISGLFAYGGGVYSDGGGIGNTKTLSVVNCTLAENMVEPPPGTPSFLLGMGYWRGGGLYMSNGYLTMQSSTVVDNAVYGVARTDDLDKPNLAGGIAATIGNAHAVENMTIGHSIITGNWVHEVEGSSYPHDIFTGSLLHFRSKGYNRIGTLDFNQILVPVGEPNWGSLCRRHFPQAGDEADVDMADVLNLVSGVTRSDIINSVGVNPTDPVVLAYEPTGNAIDQIQATGYSISETIAEYTLAQNGDDDFLVILLDRLESHYNLTDFADSFTTEFETFLHEVDLALLAEQIAGMGSELLGEDAWAALFSAGPLSENSDISMTIRTNPVFYVQLEAVDQHATARPGGTLGDIGAVEVP